MQTHGEPSATTLDWITRLMSVDTTSRNSNTPLVDLVVPALRSAGVEPVLVPSPDGTKNNVIATFPAADGRVTGGIVLSGHTDVVPVDGQEWSSDPFTPEIRDGRLYGRGACDMKSFVGVLMSRVPAIAAADLREPIHFALSYDEEVGCTGAISLVENLVARGIRPRACVVGEPSSMQVIRGHKSMNVLQADFRGVAVHSSLAPHGVNAIEHAASFIRFFRGMADGFRDDGPYDPAYPVPYTTASVNVVHGGIALNTVPADCSVTVEFRGLGTVDPAEIITRLHAEIARIHADMQRENPQASAELHVIAKAPGLETPADSAVVALVQSWGGDPTDGKVTYGTEAGLFHNAGIPTVVCGPGDIAQAHAPNEFIELDQIARCESMIDAAIAHVRA